MRFEEEILELREGLLAGQYPVGRYHRFIVRDPKLRTIHAAAFQERVMHHALMRVVGPILERSTVFDSYACHAGKGQWGAVRRAERFARRYGFFLKFDIRKYFDNIDHPILLRQLERRIKDRAVLDWFSRIIRSYEVAPGKGLPIGSLTSQHLANAYLGPLDRWLSGRRASGGVVRYMDDVTVWSNDLGALRGLRSDVPEFLKDTLELDVKATPYINRTGHGMDFLGCRVFPGYSLLNRRSRNRFRRRLKWVLEAVEKGRIDQSEAQCRLTSLTSFTKQVKSWRFRKRCLEDLGSESERHEPDPSGRQLEQQRQELPVGEPQQEQAGQHEEQQRIPGSPGSSLLMR